MAICLRAVVMLTATAENVHSNALQCNVRLQMLFSTQPICYLPLINCNGGVAY